MEGRRKGERSEGGRRRGEGGREGGREVEREEGMNGEVKLGGGGGRREESDGWRGEVGGV